MRRLLAGMLVLLLICSFSMPAFGAEMKLGYVDVIKVFNDYKKTKDYYEVLELQRKGKEDERDEKIAELKKLQDQYVLLSDAEKEKKKSEIEKKAQELDLFNRQTLADLRKQQNDFMLEITDEIEKIIKTISKAENFTVVLSGQTILYAGEGITDLSGKVLSELNKTYQKK